MGVKGWGGSGLGVIRIIKYEIQVCNIYNTTILFYIMLWLKMWRREVGGRR